MEGTTIRPRLRDLGIQHGVLPIGEYNAITDVSGVRVGHATIIEGMPGDGSAVARTGVTAIHPHAGSVFQSMVPAAIDVLNGSGEITGRSQLDEYGYLESPILITNTFSVGEAHRGCVEWLAQHEPSLGRRHFIIPVVAETYDGFLNEVTAQHVTREHVFAALDSAKHGTVEEGNVGGGTGMGLFGFKGGIGTASRVVDIGDRQYTAGVLVQGNTGRRPNLTVCGVPVGREIADMMPVSGSAPSASGREGSIIVVIGTDAPLTNRQLKRLCKRGMLGMGTVGCSAGHSSGDLLLAFSNAESVRLDRSNDDTLVSLTRVADQHLNPIFEAVIEATGEAILNALVAAETLTGRDGNTLYGLPHDRLQEIFVRYGRLVS